MGLPSSNCNSFATDLTFSEPSDILQMRPIRKRWLGGVLPPMT
jgi:hypothetical protein